jgi:hypothetical protein
MPFMYADLEKLENTDKVGSEQCVALVQHYAKAPAVSQWREGDSVLGNLLLQKVTAIATFVNGEYKSKPTGNHAGLYISQDAAGIWIMDQWSNNTTKPKTSERYLRRKGKDVVTGNWRDPSNNADAYSVIK